MRTIARPTAAALGLLFALLALAACGGGSGGTADSGSTSADAATSEAAASESTTEEAEAGEESSFKATPINIHKLPLGDDKYVTEGPKSGYVYSCASEYNGNGAFEEGPWIDQEAGTWNLSKKIYVEGRVHWDSEFAEKVSGSERDLEGNGLPPQTTGIFPVQESDPAYEYDRNPNEISGYTLKASLPANPKRAAEPSCIGGTIGVMKNGIALYSAFDAGGRDAVATEIQDHCDAHPEKTGQYHYHGLSTCLYERSGDSSADEPSSVLLGWAIDGFGIYAERDSEGTLLSSADLDVCHGRTSTVEWNGEKRRMYHYVMTLDFPYTVACYRGTPITEAEGLNIGNPGGGSPGEAPLGAGMIGFFAPPLLAVLLLGFGIERLARRRRRPI
jgi:YHYH protein